MNERGRSESGDISVTVRPKREWDNMMSTIKDEGLTAAKEIHEHGHNFIVEPLAPAQVLEGDSIPLSGVVIRLDWKVATRQEMVKSAREIISKAYLLDCLDPALPTALASVIEGKGLYEYSIGEFFQLYGRFEGKYNLTKGSDTKEQMEVLLKGDTRYLKPYKEHGKWVSHPMPYAVRNILAHIRNNPNTLDEEGKDLRTSIELLRSWVS